MTDDKLRSEDDESDIPLEDALTKRPVTEDLWLADQEADEPENKISDVPFGYDEEEEANPPQFTIATMLMLTFVVAFLFAVERLIAGDSDLELNAIVLGIVCPPVIAYFLATGRHLAISMMLAIYVTAFLCRMIGWSAPDAITILSSVVLLFYTFAASGGAAVRFDLQMPLLGIPILIGLGTLVWWAFSEPGREEGERNFFVLLIGAGAGLRFSLGVVHRMFGLH